MISVVGNLTGGMIESYGFFELNISFIYLIKFNVFTSKQNNTLLVNLKLQFSLFNFSDKNRDNVSIRANYDMRYLGSTNNQQIV